MKLGTSNTDGSRDADTLLLLTGVSVTVTVGLWFLRILVPLPGWSLLVGTWLTVSLLLTHWSPLRPRAGMYVLFLVILATGIIFAFSLTPDTGIIGRDAHFDVYAAQTIQDSGVYGPETAQHHRIDRTATWPVLHLLAVPLSSMTNLDIFSLDAPGVTIAQLLPVLLYSLTPVGLFLLGGSLGLSARASFLYASASGLFYYTLEFHSFFVRESVSFPLLLLALWGTLEATGLSPQPSSRRRRAGMAASTLLLIAALILSHNLTPLIFVSAVVGLSISLAKAPRPGHRAILLAGTSLILYVSVNLLRVGPSSVELVYFFAKLIGLDEVGIQAEIGSGYGVMEVLQAWGPKLSARWALRFLFAGVSSWILVHALRNRGDESDRYPKAAVGLVWGGIFVVLIWLNVSGMLKAGVPRLEQFAWLLVLPPVIGYLRGSDEPRWLPAILIAVFLAYSLFSLPYHVVDPRATPDYEHGETSITYGRGIYAPVLWYDGSLGVVADVTFQELFGLTAREVDTSRQAFGLDDGEPKRPSIVFLRQENRELLYGVGAGLERFSLQDTVLILGDQQESTDLLYENGEAWVLSIHSR